MKTLALPRVIVLVATYNGFSWIRQQLDSILHQTGVDVTVVIRDDGSSDGTQDILDEYALKYPNVWRLHVPSQGRGAAENFYCLLRNVVVANGYLALSDQDDVWRLDKLERAIAQMAVNGAKAYSSNVMSVEPSGRQSLVKKDYPQAEFDYLFEGPGPGSTFVLAAPLADKLSAMLRNHLDLSQKVAIHDWFIYAYMRSSGFKWLIDSYPGLLYRQHESNEIGANIGVLASFKRARYLFREGGIEQAVKLRAVLFDRTAKDPYPYPLGRAAMLNLIWNASKYRRRPRDRWVFRMAMLAALILRRKIA